ncbi:MAG: phosphomannomutase/phosphoglucomutase [Spirochaetaceae bacterium]|nr:MAG: phosphomannomutase/phosphoglucomutase [Spirochaetaceae bacterium]
MAGVFKTYDIRGIYGKGIDTALAYNVGRAFARWSKKDSFMIGYDARTYSEELYQALGHGLVAEGKRVRGIGMVTTPQLHYYQMEEGYGGAVMVTASHNPPEYHGFKLYDDRGGSVSYDKGLKEIEALIAGIGEEPARRGGSFEEADRLDEYIEFVTSPLEGEKIASKVVIDVGGGSAGRVFRTLSDKLALSSYILNEQPDGSFLNRDPNPLKPESRIHAAARVLEHGADVGALLDGDGDRVVFLDEHGESVANYYIAALIAEELLSKQPGAAIVYDLISSRALPQRIAELGGKPVVSRVGYTFLYDAMIAEGAAFGAETSGHVYFKVTESFYTESAAYALAVLLKLLHRRRKPLSKLLEPLRERYHQSAEINIEIGDKEGALAEIEQRYRGAGATIGKLDGVSVDFPEYWFNVRPSNTEPLIRLRLEAVSRQLAEQKTKEVVEFLKRFT